MAAPTEYYVDPLGGSDTTGNGSIGTPWKSVQKALNTITRNTTSGDRINVKAGAADVLSAVLSFTTYGSIISGSAPLIIQGCTSAANDGGIGEIDGGGANSIFPSVNGSLLIRHLKIGNCGASADAVTLGAYTSIVECEVYGARDGIVATTISVDVISNHIHDCSRYGILVSAGADIAGNYVTQSTGTAAIHVTATARIQENIVSVSGAVSGISIANYYCRVWRNSVLSNGGTGSGITWTSDVAGWGGACINNLVDGFSGSGGVGIITGSTANVDSRNVYGNAVNNCSTAYSFPDQLIPNDGSNETLSGTPFAKSGSNTFANRFVYFAPVDVGSVLTGAFPSGCNLPKGAVGPASGGGGSYNPFRTPFAFGAAP